MKLSSSIVILLTFTSLVCASGNDGMSLSTNNDSVQKLLEKKKSRPIIHDDISRKSENKLTKTGTTTNPVVFSPISSSSLSDNHPSSSNENVITIYGLDRNIPLTKDEAAFLEETIKDAYSEIHEGQIEEEEELDENIITIYGLDRSISLTKDEAEFLEETIKDAYNEIHEVQVEIATGNKNNKHAENIPTVANLRATRNPVVTEAEAEAEEEEAENDSSAIPQNFTFDSFTVFFFIVSSLYIVLA